ncbi:MAG: hypothetical protein BWY65_01965 [Firmicutes bacterium ADurb.Bin373]|nr:MAG: hypothetical protein BWY65_01965 [Firmicutes bacterium ADurb.Bin373]
MITDRKLRVTPLTRWIPKSEPMPKRINNRAEKPITVVAALAATAGRACFMARRMASRGSWDIRYLLKLCKRKIA